MKQKRVIITGANGFTGKYLAQELARYDIYSICIWHHNRPENIREFEWRQADLLNMEECERLVADVKPDAVIHLAAQNSIITAKESPQQTIKSNILGTVNLLEAVRKNRIDSRCILAGSAAVYHAPDGNHKITEETPVECKNMYALTKHVQEQIADRYREDYNMNIIVSRPFNYTGYLQGENCFVPSLCRQVSDIVKGYREPVLTLGNLSVCRDFSDVRDIVTAYRLLLDNDTPEGIYNIASGKAVRLLDIVNYLCNKSETEIKIHIEQSLVRKDDIPYICGDAKKIREAAGWKPDYSIYDTIDWIFDKMQGEDS